MLRVLVWDDEGVANEMVEAWFGQRVELAKPGGGHLVNWEQAVRLLVTEGPWDIVVADLRDTEFYQANAGEFTACWYDTLNQNPDLLAKLRYILAECPFADLNAAAQGELPAWLGAQDLGVGLLLLAQALDVPERFLLSGKVLDDARGPKAAHELTVIGAIRSGALVKEHPAWSRARLEIAIARVERQRAAELGRMVPDLYEVLVLENCEGDEDKEIRRHLRLRISEKKTEPDAGSLSDEIDLYGDHALIFQIIADNDGEPVSARGLFEFINRLRGQKKQYDLYTAGDTRDFLAKYGVKLLGEQPGQQGRQMCLPTNNTLCEWQRYGGDDHTPTNERDEGHTCYAKIGYCPKRLMKPRPPERYVNALETEASIRTKVKELRKELRGMNSVFGPAFVGEKGLIHTVRGRGRGGYALAGSIAYADD